MAYPVSFVFCHLFIVESEDVNANQNISENWEKNNN